MFGLIIVQLAKASPLVKLGLVCKMNFPSQVSVVLCGLWVRKKARHGLCPDNCLL